MTDWKLAHYNHAHVSSTDLNFDHPAKRHEATELQTCADIANLHQRIIRIIDIMVNKIDKLIWEKPGGHEKGLKSTPITVSDIAYGGQPFVAGVELSPDHPAINGSWSVTIYQCDRAIRTGPF